MKPGQNSVERIRRHEVFRALKKVDFSPEEEEGIDRSDEERRGESQTLRRSLGELPKGEGGTLEKAPAAGCTDTDLPAGRRYFGQSDKPLIGTAHVYHAMWVMFTETRCEWRSTRTGFAYSIRRLEISTERTIRHVKEDSLCRACRTERR